jgi:glycosyltransferase involved in cell wall biosynthesis
MKGAGINVLTLHDLNFLHVKGKAKARRYLKKVQQNVDRSDALVFVSHFTREESHRYLNIPADMTTTVIYNGVELPKVDPVKPDFLETDLFLFSIGQFLAKKNFHVLVPFLKTLPDEIKLVIAGENNTAYGDFVKKTVTENNLQKRVLIPGPVTEAEKLYLYRHCMAFVFPSLAEGFGLPVVEAMRAGKPVFCSDKTSLKEIGGPHVHFWECFDAETMSKVYFAGMTGFNELKKNAAYDYSLKYSWQGNAKETLSLYKTLLSRL